MTTNHRVTLTAAVSLLGALHLACSSQSDEANAAGATEPEPSSPSSTPDGSCPTGLAACAGRCVDLEINLDHCGDCDRACASGENCQAGACVPSGSGETLPPTGGSGGSGATEPGASGGSSSGDQLYAVSALDPTEASNGWGPVEVDASNGEDAAGDGSAITLGGVAYDHGLGVHAESDLRFALGGNCTAFESDVGVDDEVGDAGTVTFEVWGDDQLLYDSAVLTGADGAERVSVDVSGVHELRLVVTDAGDDFMMDHADWAGASLLCHSDPSTASGGTGDAGGSGGTAGTGGAAGTGGGAETGGTSGSAGSGVTGGGGTTVDVAAHLLACAEGTPSELAAYGVPSNWSWVAGATGTTTNPPGGEYTNANYWGAVFRGPSNRTPANTMVELRNCSLWFLYDGESAWVQADNDVALGGSTFSPTYNGGGPNPEVLVDHADGQDVVPAVEYIWHFWPEGGYQPFRYNDVREVLSNCQTRLALRDPNGADDRAEAEYVVHMGADWRNPNDPGCASDGYICPSFGVSRFEVVQTYWRNTTFHSMTDSDISAGVPLPPASIFDLPQ